MAKYCVKCGEKNPNDAVACSCCGMSLGGESAENPVTMKTTEKKQYANIQVESKGVKKDTTKVPIFSKTSDESFSLELDKLNQSTQLLKKDLIQEIQCQNDFIYVLSEQSDFSSTEYKVLNSIGIKGLLKCKRIKYNGKDALYYMTGQLKSLDILLPAVDSSRFLYILENLFNQINVIKSNGFLADTGLDVRIQRIFLDSADGKIYLTYIPINQRCYPDTMYLEHDLREDMAYIIRTTPTIQNSSVMNIAQMLVEPACSLGNLLSAIRQNRSMSTYTGR